MDACTPWAGMFCKDADPLIIEQLKAEGKLFRAQEYTHSYPFCWRCDTPLLYYARSTWFIRMTAVRDQLVKKQPPVNWLPENIKEGRMGNFVENGSTGAFSRERYQHAVADLTCECGYIEAIGGIQDLGDHGRTPDDLELHKPFIDKVTFPAW